MNVGISEYITSQKIDESRKLLKETNLKIYEISDTTTELLDSLDKEVDMTVLAVGIWEC